MPILQQNALVTIYLKAFLLTITSINTSYATKPSVSSQCLTLGSRNFIKFTSIKVAALC
ncbi:UNVERIFIED_CONTAM: hypothetical protein LBW93_03040 [Wolbachia endosymbiont of Nasonia longicornis]